MQSGNGAASAGGEQALAVAAQLALLALLDAGTGLGPIGWAAGSCYAAALYLLLSGALRRSPNRSLGPADRVTLGRAVLVGGVTALVAAGAAGEAVPLAILVALAAVALVLDAVDGYVARRTATESPLGARFDMEVDAFLILVLSVHAASVFGAWALAIGAMRYVFGAAAWAAPWLGAELPPSFARKTVAALQGIALVAAVSGVPPAPLPIAVLASALALLLWSFGRDVEWLWRHRPRSDRQEVSPLAVAVRGGLHPQGVLAGSSRRD